MPADRLKLFCIPHAGGTASVFRPWRRRFPATIEVVPLELPGHGTRGREAFAQSISSAAEDLLEAAENRLVRPVAGEDGRPNGDDGPARRTAEVSIHQEHGEVLTGRLESLVG
ncbi:thioesterase domain-containing protein [Frankia sp. AiPs1]|uniref:thioesterase II family protein n=1 Tax=Frankia sp. AiPs1 TaxID=573493 RepID=UPI002042F32B|nr:thioesterase domain-containing protein [Frankia sp. AiPs1]MCM3922488.1 thioesterase domain-containing protein [Frankia sp. AiPs1]